MNDSFFGKNGTLQGVKNVVQDIQSFQNAGQDSKSRFGALANIVKVVMSLFA